MTQARSACRPLSSASADGIRLVFGSRLLLTLLLFGWLAGFHIVPEDLAAPYARSPHGSVLTVGLLMAAVPLGTVIGAFLLGRAAAPSARILADAGGAYELDPPVGPADPGAAGRRGGGPAERARCLTSG